MKTNYSLTSYININKISNLDLIVLELLLSPDADVPQSTGDLDASNSSGGLGRSLNVPSAF